MTSLSIAKISFVALLFLVVAPFLLRNNNNDQQQRVSSFLRNNGLLSSSALDVHRRLENENKNDNNKNDQSKHHHHHRRPVMHTYFTALPVDHHNKSAHMSINAHDQMIQVWEESWRNAGWHTRVLTLDDAKQHAEFEEFESYIRKFTMDDYNKACFYRWLAMAAVGGGWMSDYDTIPLHGFTHQGIELPMRGAMVVYEGPHVPSLLSGSASEWLRMTRRLVEYASNHYMEDGHGRNTVSDMISLNELINKYPDMYVYQKHVAGSSSIRVMDPSGKMKWNKEICAKAVPRHWRAAHFSHDFVGNFWTPRFRNHTLEDRPMIEKMWLEDWLKHCGRQEWQEEGASSRTS